MGAPLKSCGVSGIHAGIETGTMEMGVSRKLFLALAIVAAATGFAGLAGAAEPLPWQMNFQPAVTPVAEEAHRFHDLLLVIIAAISVFVLALMVYCFVRFNE
jgi:cytochrome c oxidase subunit 2